MPAKYSLDRKIEALNLLDQHDGDLYLVKSRLKIPLKVLKGWRADQDNLRRSYEDRQYHYSAKLKLELLQDMRETSRDIMKKIKSGDHEGIAVSQLAYTLSVLLNQANQLEGNFEDAADPQEGTEQANRIRFVYEDNAQDVPPWADGDPQELGLLESLIARTALEEAGIGADLHFESLPPEAQALPEGRLDLENAESILEQSDKRRQTPKRGRNRPKRGAD